jgi:iron-sulfur cluster repair protein YtfE (RIC family)
MSEISELTPPAANHLATGAGTKMKSSTPYGVTRMVKAIQTNRSELFGPRGRRAALVAAYPELDEVCTALGFGVGFSLGEWSTAPAWAALTLARAARPPLPPSVPEQDWTMATIPELIADIVTAYHIPLRHELERMMIIIDHLAVVHQHAVFTALRTVYQDFNDQLSLHLDQEESDLFPLCIELEEALSGRQAWEERDLTSLVRFTWHGHADYESGLVRIMDLLEAATSITGSRDPDIAVFREGLKAMARDMAIHTAKEAELLLPAAIFSEELLRSRPSTERIQRMAQR